MIRRADPADLESVKRLLALYFEEWRIVNRDSEGAILTALTDPVLGYLVAEKKGVVLGCVLARSLPTIAGAAEMKRLFVAPPARGQGLARLLVAELERQAAGAGFSSLYLDSKTEFTAAVSLYTSLGYVAIPRYNDNPEATLFFRKQLK